MKSVQYPADFQHLDSIRDFVGETAERAGFSSKEIYSIQLAADEACSNVIEHAYEGISGGKIEVECEARDGQIVIVIHDHGKIFDMSAVRQPNLGRDLSEREVGGLGVYLIHKLMDEVSFQSSKKHGNTLTMKKRKSGDV
ncbi:MAG: ATP-binding protein [Chloroflexi bacterium]|nr:ATP-binding protein [Chloroflexota bacterium]